MDAAEMDGGEQSAGANGGQPFGSRLDISFAAYMSGSCQTANGPDQAEARDMSQRPVLGSGEPDLNVRDWGA
jgi:hypothetical protein